MTFLFESGSVSRRVISPAGAELIAVISNTTLCAEISRSGTQLLHMTTALWQSSSREIKTKAENGSSFVDYMSACFSRKVKKQERFGGKTLHLKCKAATFCTIFLINHYIQYFTDSLYGQAKLITRSRSGAGQTFSLASVTQHLRQLFFHCTFWKNICQKFSAHISANPVESLQSLIRETTSVQTLEFTDHHLVNLSALT